MADGFIHTVHSGGQWRNSVEGEEGALSATFETNAEAVEAGRNEARQRRTKHLIHKRLRRSPVYPREIRPALSGSGRGETTSARATRCPAG
jgi:hypothetical protein